MGAAKKIEMLPEERYIQDRLKDGTCVRQDFSMKAIGRPDTAYQARVEHLDVAHAKRFADMLGSGTPLWPVVVFVATVGTKMRAILADGFHRHHAYHSLKRPSIPAYVVTVSADRLEHEARLYASMCNQLATKGRSKEDMRKAVEILLADPECWDWADRRISDHCGVSPTTVSKYRCEYANQNNIALPEKVTCSDGRSVFKGSKERVRGYTCRVGKNKGNTSFHKRIDGESVYLGTTEDEAKKKFDQIIESKNVRKLKLERNTLIPYFTRNGFAFHSCLGPGFQSRFISGYYGHGVVLKACKFENETDISSVVGSLLLLRRKMGNLRARMIVVCYREDGPQEEIGLACQEGVEFLTPEELVDSLRRGPLSD